MMQHMTYLSHIATSGDRWDLLALRYYGDPLLMGPLLRANPAVANRTMLDAGTVLAIPIVDRTEVAPTKPETVGWR